MSQNDYKLLKLNMNDNYSLSDISLAYNNRLSKLNEEIIKLRNAYKNVSLHRKFQQQNRVLYEFPDRQSFYYSKASVSNYKNGVLEKKTYENNNGKLQTIEEKHNFRLPKILKNSNNGITIRYG